jgi:hypothetical protein
MSSNTIRSIPNNSVKCTCDSSNEFLKDFSTNHEKTICGICKNPLAFGALIDSNVTIAEIEMIEHFLGEDLRLIMEN